MSNLYLSRDRQHLARLQRERRARMVRIDYMPDGNALGVLRAVQSTKRPGSLAATNSAVIDVIVNEWAALTGINKAQVATAMSSADHPELCDTKRARAYDFGASSPAWVANLQQQTTASNENRRNPCGARRHRDGLPCKALSQPGKRRCRFHGGSSTGPRTQEGKARSLRNLKQWQRPRSSNEAI